LPIGLKESEKLPQPIFTPSTKADEGLHDINIEYKEAENLIGVAVADQVRKLTLAIYKKGSELAASKGIIIADTKFEFGLIGKDLILIDEVLTPDSSRFWPKASYAPGGAQKSFDKQYLRDHLNSLTWDKTPPGPSLPREIISKTRSKYLEALTLLTGSKHGL
jgi:phosphoribosylaminoimidazole-succinocarboxamide synthase